MSNLQGREAEPIPNDLNPQEQPLADVVPIGIAYSQAAPALEAYEVQPEPTKYKNDFNRVAVAREDETAFEELIDGYKSLIYKLASDRFIIGASPDDVVQEAMIGFMKGVRDYDGIKSSFKHFVDLCIRRQIDSAARSGDRQKHSPLNDSVRVIVSPDGNTEDITDFFTSDEGTPEDNVIGKEFGGELVGAVSGMSNLEQQVLHMELVGKTYKEISAELGITTKSVDNTLTRARRKLDKFFNEREVGYLD